MEETLLPAQKWNLFYYTQNSQDAVIKKRLTQIEHNSNNVAGNTEIASKNENSDSGLDEKNSIIWILAKSQNSITDNYFLQINPMISCLVFLKRGTKIIVN